MARFTFPLGVALFVCAMENQHAWAIDACETIRKNIGWGPGQLINLDTHNAAGQFSTPTPPKPSDLHLVYVVPASQNSTGALIVKVRHQLPKDANAKTSEGFPSADYIRLQRLGHISACTNQVKRPYDTSVKLEHYVDEHYYGITYSSMDDFHAEVGYRTRHYSAFGFGLDRSVCKNTYDPETRAYFLYSENPTVATSGEVYARRAAKLAKQVGFVSEAFADQGPRYRDKLNTLIVPYRRPNPTSESCVSFDVAVPGKAGETDIEVIDSDDGPAFHGTWQINWGQN